MSPHPRVVVGYYGAIAPWLDYKLAGELAAARPDLEFVFIGPLYSVDSSDLPSRANLHWLGAVPYMDLPEYAVWFDVCIIPFKSGRIAQTTSPLKLFEHFALQKPVVVNADMRECTQYSEVFAARSVHDYSDALDRALQIRNDPSYVARLQTLARENSWDRRAELLANAMRKRSAPLARYCDLRDGRIAAVNLEAPRANVRICAELEARRVRFWLASSAVRSGDSASFVWAMPGLALDRFRIQFSVHVNQNEAICARNMALLQIWFGTELIAQDRVGAHAKPVEITLTLSKRQPGFECRLTVIHDAWEDWSWGEALAVELRDLRVTELRQADPNVLTISSATAQIDWLAASRLSQDRQ